MADVVERLRDHSTRINGLPLNTENAAVMRDAITEIESLRARLSQAGAGGVVVKPLEWRHVDVEWFEAHTPLGMYEVSDVGWSFEPSLKRRYSESPSADEAKAAAQVDYEARILAALAPSPSAGVKCTYCGDTGTIPDRVDGEITCTECGYATPPAPVQTASVGAVAAFLKERDESLLAGEADDAERTASAQEILRLASLTAPTQGDGGLIATPALRTCGPLVPLGADFEAVYDAHVADLYDPSTPSPSPASAPSPGGGPAVTETPATSNPQSACAGEEAGQSAEEVQQQRTASSAFAKLLLTAKTLYANAEGCAVNHYGDDFATHGLPGWLSDCAADIQVAEQALANPSPAGGVREAIEVALKWDQNRDFIMPYRVRDKLRAALSTPAPGHGEGGL